MKLATLFAAFLLALGGQAFAANSHKHNDDHTPLHGGIVVETSDMDFELVAKPELIALYLRHHGNALDTKGATGKVVVLTGSEKVEAGLTAAGENKVEAKGAFKIAPGTKVVATVQLPGKKVMNVRFALK